MRRILFAWRFSVRVARLGVLPALCSVLLLAGCGGSQPTSTDKSGPATAVAAEPTVHVVEAALRPWPRTVRTQGTLIEDEYAQLGAKVAGRIKAVHVDLGTKVEQGQPVAEIDIEEFDLRVQQAEAQVAQARARVGLKPGVPDDKLDPLKAAPVQQEKATLDEARHNVERVRGLMGKGVITPEEIQARESLLAVAQAKYDSSLNAVQEQIAVLALKRSELALALQNRQDATIKAPFMGVIQETHVAPGSFVNIGEPLVTLVRTDPLRFRTGVPERSAIGVELGQLVRIHLEGRATPLEVQISRISPALDVSSRALIIEADVDNADGRLRTGLFAEADILVGADERALAVPDSSIVAFGGVEKVWIVKDNKAHAQPIRTGRRNGRMVEVLEGLTAGELIVTNAAEGREGVVHVSPTPPTNSADQAALLGQ